MLPTPMCTLTLGSLLTPEFGFLGTAGNWTGRDDVWIVYNETGNDNGEQGGYPKGEGYWHGPLTVGYGVSSRHFAYKAPNNNCKKH